MSTKRDPDPIDRLLDVAVYAPLGLALSARELLPEWADRGRRQLAAQLPMARTVGEIAVRQGTKQARATLTRLRRQTDELLNDVRAGASKVVEEPASPPTPPPPVVSAESPPVAKPQGPAPAEHDEEEAKAWIATRPPGLESSRLAIPGYDMLSASQVVQRLAGLSPEELEAVRVYELAGRARKTVLLRVAQLRPDS